MFDKPLSNNKPFDKQEAFNKSFIGLASQKFERAINIDATMCTYDDGYGNHCAIGWLIVDKEDIHKTAHEGGISVSNMIQDMLNVTGDSENIAFLIKLQDAHDQSESPNDMRRRLCGVATVYGLSIPDIAEDIDGNIVLEDE